MEEPFNEQDARRQEHLYDAKQDYKAETQEESKIRYDSLTKKEPKTHHLSFMDLYGKDSLKGMEDGDIVWVRQSGGSVERYIVRVNRILDRF